MHTGVETGGNRKACEHARTATQLRVHINLAQETITEISRYLSHANVAVTIKSMLTF